MLLPLRSNTSATAPPAPACSLPICRKSYVKNTNHIPAARGHGLPDRQRRLSSAPVRGRFLTRMGLLDNIFPGGNSPFQPFVTVNNVRSIIPARRLTTGTAAPLTITTLNPNLKPPEAWNWNVTLSVNCRCNPCFRWPMSAHRGMHGWQVYDINQPHGGALLANPGVTSITCGPTKDSRPSRKKRATSTPCTIRCSSHGTAASPAAPASACLHALQEHGQRLELPRHRARHLQHQQPVGAFGVRYPSCRDHQLHLRSAVLQGQQAARWQDCSADGRSTASRSSRPARLAASAPTTTMQAWANTAASAAARRASSGCSTVPHDQHRRLCRPDLPDSARYFTAHVNAPTPALSTCSPAFATPSTARASRIGTSALFKTFADQRADQFPVPRRGLRLHQPSKLGGNQYYWWTEFQSHFRHLRPRYRKERSCPQLAALSEIQF